MNLVELAEHIATLAHAGQVDKAGVAYIEHPRAVVSILRAAGAPDEALALGWIHDVLEDTDWTANDLRQAGIPLLIVESALCISHWPNEPLEVYLARVLRSALARCVKLADVRHNGNRERLALLEPVTQARLIRKYQRTLDLLLSGV